MLVSDLMSRPCHQIWGITFGLVLSLGAPSLAYGQSDDDRAGARAAAAAGIEAYNSGRFDNAYDLLNRAESLVHAPTHLLYMARAAAKLGRLVQAREIYIRIGQEQLIAAAPRAFVEAQQAAAQEQRAVEARLSYLTVTVEGASAADAKVSIDARIIPSVLMGVPFPVDPGTHELFATLQSGAHSENTKVTLSEGQRDRISLKIVTNAGNGAPVVASTATTSPTNAATQPATPTTTKPGVAASSRVRKSPVLAWVSLGVGTVGAGLGTVFLIQRSSKKGDADSAFNACNPNVCTPAQRDNVASLDKSSASAGTLALVSYGVGAAALTTGFYLLFSSNSDSDPKKDSARFVPTVGPKFVGATLSF